VTNEKGEKLSKQTLAAPLDVNATAELLTRALHFLGLDEGLARNGILPLA
jgi:hypothetical protein